MNPLPPRHLARKTIAFARGVRRKQPSFYTVDFLERRVLLTLFVVQYPPNVGVPSGTQNSSVGEYDSNGTAINASLITGLIMPRGIAVSGSDLFVTSYMAYDAAGDQSSVIQEYTQTGTLLNPDLIPGPAAFGKSIQPPSVYSDLQILGNDLYFDTDTGIYEYTTSGTLLRSNILDPNQTAIGVGAFLVTGSDIFIVHGGAPGSGGDLYAPNTGYVSEYTIEGNLVNANYITGLNEPDAITMYGSDLFIASGNPGGVAEYGVTIPASLINPSLITDPGDVDGTEIASDGQGDLYITNDAAAGPTEPTNGISEYTVQGTTISSVLIPYPYLQSDFQIAIPQSNLPNELVVTQSPPHSNAAGTLPTITVDVDDPSGNLMSSNASDVTLNLAGGPSGASLGGTTTVAAVNGVATFSDVTLTTAGIGYNLVATDSDATVATDSTTPFNITSTTPTSTLNPTVVKDTLKAAVVAGTKVNAAVTVKVSNSGATISGPITVNLYASTTTTTTGATLIDTLPVKSLKLKTGKATAFSLKISELPSTLAGTYYLVAQITSSGGTSAAAASAGTVTVAPPFVMLAAPAIVPPKSVKPGKKTSAVVTITNSGNIPATGLLEVVLTARPPGTSGSADIPIQTVSEKIKIAPNKSGKVGVTFLVPNTLPVGTYSLVAQIDPNNAFNESSVPDPIVSLLTFTVT
jgi:hypothetical protein